MVGAMEKLVAAFGERVVGLQDEGSEDVDAEDEQGEADETLGPAVDSGGQADAEKNDDGAESGDGEGVAEGVDHAEPEGGAPGRLDADDVGDGGDVVVIEAVAKAEHGCGEERDVERGVHGRPHSSRMACEVLTI